VNLLYTIPKIAVLESVNSWLPLTENWIFNHLCRLPDSIELHILCNHMENQAQFSGPQIHCRNRRGSPGWLRWKTMGKLRGITSETAHTAHLANRYQIKLLHSHFGNIGWDNLESAQFSRLNHVVTFYGFDVSYLPQQQTVWKTRYRELFTQADLFLVEGTHMRHCLMELGCPPDKIRVLHLGVDLTHIPFLPRQRQPEEKLKILLASTFQEKKGIPFALSVLGEFQKSHPIEVSIIGDANSEKRSQLEKQKILTALRENHLEHSVRLLGFQSHERLLQEASHHHVFIAPSMTATDGDTEGGAPVVLIEMMAAGMAAIASRHCDIPEIVKHQQTGLSFEERDAAGLLNNLEWLIQNPREWTTLAESGRRHIEAEFDIGKQAGQLTRIYQELAG
jgi:colanic acid/amylovoran biosynthesis glycosyltransferase